MLLHFGGGSLCWGVFGFLGTKVPQSVSPEVRGGPRAPPPRGSDLQSCRLCSCICNNVVAQAYVYFSVVGLFFGDFPVCIFSPSSFGPYQFLCCSPSSFFRLLVPVCPPTSISLPFSLLFSLSKGIGQANRSHTHPLHFWLVFFVVCSHAAVFSRPFRPCIPSVLAFLRGAILGPARFLDSLGTSLRFFSRTRGDKGGWSFFFCGFCFPVLWRLRRFTPFSGSCHVHTCRTQRVVKANPSASPRPPLGRVSPRGAPQARVFGHTHIGGMFAVVVLFRVTGVDI